MVFPGVALLLTVLAFNLLGDGLQDALNPRPDAMTRCRTPRNKKEGRHGTLLREQDSCRRRRHLQPWPWPRVAAATARAAAPRRRAVLRHRPRQQKGGTLKVLPARTSTTSTPARRTSSSTTRSTTRRSGRCTRTSRTTSRTRRRTSPHRLPKISDGDKTSPSTSSRHQVQPAGQPRRDVDGRQVRDRARLQPERRQRLRGGYFGDIEGARQGARAGRSPGSRRRTTRRSSSS